MGVKFLSFLAALSLGGALQAAPLEPGATLDEVYELMGAPSGMMELPDKFVLYYDTADLTLVDGKLVEAVWRSQAEADAIQAHKAKLHEDWERKQAKEAELRRQRGQEILAARRTNPGFLNLPAAQRLQAWADFLRDYPEVDATAEYEAALKDVREQAALLEAERQRYAKANTDDGWNRRSLLVDSVEVGATPGYGTWDYVGPSVAVGNKAVVVVGGNGGFGYGYCMPAQSRPILSVSYRSEDFGVQFTSGGTASPLRRNSYVPQRQPVVIVTGD